MVKSYAKGTAAKLSNNFKSTEFDCKCKYSDCKKTLIDLDGVECLQKARDLVGKPITINSGFRCKTHNKKVGGVSSSLHLKGTAFDLACPKGIGLNDFAFICEQAGFHGVLRYDGENFVHCDMRSGKYYGVTSNGGKSFKQVETFNPIPKQETVEIILPILKKGDKSEVVKTIQGLLDFKGFNGKNGKKINADGDFGTNTEFAIEQMQKKEKISASKVMDLETWKKLLGVK
jgi:hypothetical protein